MAVTRFVNAASSAGGDGTTNATAGANRAYSSLSEWEAAEQGDLSSLGLSTVKCEGTTNDTAQLVIAGWTNASATDYIQIEASATGIHDGTADSGFVLSRSSGHAIENDIPYTRIGRAGFGIDIKSTSTSSSDEGIRFDCSASDLETCYVVGNIIRSTTSTSSKDGIYLNPSNGTSAITLNCFANIIYGWNRGGMHAQNFQGTNTMLVNCIQNTCHGNGDGSANTGDILGRDTASGTTTIDSFNNICASATSFRDQSATNTVWTGSNNVTADGEFDRGSMTAGAQATDGVAVVTKSSGAWIVFNNITGGSEDYQLLDDAAGNLPIDFGTDQTSTVPTDAIGNSYATTPDNGAFEFQAAGGETVVVPVGSIALSGQTPTILATDDKSFDIPVGTISLSGQVPTIQAGLDIDITVPAGSISLSGQIPAIINNVDVGIPVGSILLSGQVPVVQAGGNISVEVPVGSISLNGLVPTVIAADNQEVIAPVGSILLSGQVPTIQTTNNIDVVIPVGAILLDGFAPNANVTDNKQIEVPTGSIALSGQVPTVALGPLTIVVPVGAITLSGLVPIVISVVSPDSFVSVIGAIDETGTDSIGFITAKGSSTIGNIDDVISTSGTIDAGSVSGSGKIDKSGNSVLGEL